MENAIEDHTQTHSHEKVIEIDGYIRVGTLANISKNYKGKREMCTMT